MEWSLDERTAAVEPAFFKLRITKLVDSNIVGVNISGESISFPVFVEGSTTCSGCRESYPFKVETYRSAYMSQMISCSSCGLEFQVFSAYYPKDDDRIFVYSAIYSYRQGQSLNKGLITVTNVTED